MTSSQGTSSTESQMTEQQPEEQLQKAERTVERKKSVNAKTSIQELASELDMSVKYNKLNTKGLTELLEFKNVMLFTEFFLVVKDSKELDVAFVFLYQLVKGNETLQAMIQEQTEVKLDGFKSIEDAFVFVDDIVKTGASQERKTTVCVMGNTSAGKSSLVRTLERYCKDKAEKPRAVLTGEEENKGLIETKVMELVKDVKIEPKLEFALKVEDSRHAPSFSLISLSTEGKDEKTDDENERRDNDIQMSFIDFAGHSEYVSCSTLFMKKKGVFLICFDTSKLAKLEKPIEEGYHPAIGTYFEIVTEKCPTPIFMLVANKMDQCKPDVKDLLEKVLETAREHLESIATRSNRLNKAFLFNEVIETSAADEAQLERYLENLCGKLSAVCDHKELMDVRLKTIPTVWKDMIGNLRQRLQVSIADVEEEYERMLDTIKTHRRSLVDEIELIEKQHDSIDTNEGLERTLILKGDDFSKWAEMMRKAFTEPPTKNFEQDIRTEESYVEQSSNKPESLLRHFSNKSVVGQGKRQTSEPGSGTIRERSAGEKSKSAGDEKRRSMLKVAVEAVGGLFSGTPEPAVSEDFYQDENLKLIEEEQVPESQKAGTVRHRSSVRHKVITILQAFSADNDIFWFSDILELKDTVIPEPMKLIKALRTIIRHDIASALKDKVNFEESSDLLEKGIVSRELFEVLHAAANEEEASRLTVDQTWQFLIKLNLATQMDSMNSSHRLYIPSLIPETNEKAIKKAVAKMRKSKHALGFYTSFKKTDSVSDLFSKFICKLASPKEFFYGRKNPGISFDISFVAKIENRNLGIVAGTKGCLNWKGKGGSQTAVDFVIVEMECDDTDKQLKFARNKGICIYLQARKDTGDFEHFHAIRLFDDILEDLVKKCSQGGDVVDKTGMHRFLMCPACMVKGKNQFFVKVGRGFEPQNPNERCRSLVHEDFAQSQDLSSEDEGSDSEDEDHTVDERQRILIKDEEEKESALGEFLKKGIQTIPKKPFRELESDLQVGQQIWIYRDGRTDPYNPVAVLMPYAHVAVYVGLEGGKKKVVHVSKASALKGVMTATIEKVSLARVIKPEDLVFLGHEIPGAKRAFNARDQIARKANVLAKSQLLFDYDHRDNCEAFANILIGVDLPSEQAEHTHMCIRSFCCMINCFRCYRKRMDLREVVKDVLGKDQRDN